MDSLLTRITINPAVCNGEPTIRNMRFTVAQLLELLAAGMTTNEILGDYPYLEELDIEASLVYQHEVVIKYKDTKTLEILKSLAKYFDFFILPKKKTSISGGKNDYDYINGVAIQFGDRSIDIAQLNSIFTGKNIDAKKLRTEAWRRKK